jgi:chemosensory pili system protein ChpB (putative protein-glutamate methylesterase)
VPESPAVALLFEDVALGAQLRNALLERGARIVHEGALGSLDPAQLLAVDADVLVVNLETEDDNALDRLYALIEGERPRVVFNDAQASRKLEGWDRARWARHLAMKALAVGEVDPPRPEDARAFQAPAAMVAEEAPPPAAAPVDQDAAHQQTVAASETLAAELEALLAAEQPAEEADDFGHGLNYAAGSDSPVEELQFAAAADLADAGARIALASDHAGESVDLRIASERVASQDVTAEGAPTDRFDPVGIASEVSADPSAAMVEAETIAPVSAPAAPAWLSLVDEAEPSAAAAPSPSTNSVQPPPLPPMGRISDSWSLLDEEAPIPPLPKAERVAASSFGIQVQDAADYLAPQAEMDHAESPIVPGFSLELMSIEEAIAPQIYEPTHEMLLDELTTGSVMGRLVLLGATTEGTTAVCEFLSYLPVDLPVTVLHTQHQAGKPSDALVEHLAESCRLPVRLATQGMRARPSEVLVVPSDQQVRLRRSGLVELQPLGEQSRQTPSIDVSFTLAASEFGADALAIVFAGRSTDAVGGCQAVHDRGGQVWVEAPSVEHGADMVSGVRAERLSHYAGTPAALAARLVEEVSMESRS